MSETAVTPTESVPPQNIESALAAHYAPPTWTWFEEVFGSVGGGGSRADGIAVAMWRSRALEIHGVEVKRTRSDWLRELKNPAKAEEIFQYCDRWWLAITDEKILKPDELPPNWGLLLFTGGRIVTKVKAPQLQPAVMTKHFLCSVIRMAHKAIERERNADPRGRFHQEYQRGYAAGTKSRGYEIESAERKFRELSESVSEFEAASGVNIRRAWDHERIGHAVKFVVDGGLAHEREGIETLRSRAMDCVQTLNAVLAVKIVPPPQPQANAADIK